LFTYAGYCGYLPPYLLAKKTQGEMVGIASLIKSQTHPV